MSVRVPRRGRALPLAALALLAAVAAHATRAQSPTPPGTDAGPMAAVTPPAEAASRESGRLAWYGKRFAGRRTASGERFDPSALTMAHRSLPFGTRVKVTDPSTGRSVMVRVNDRGPTQLDRIGDLSREAARQLGMLRRGVIDAELEVVAVN